LRLGPSTPGDYVRARVLVPLNPGVTLAEASARAGALAADLAVAVGSAQSTQAAASEQRARAEGMSWLL
jgi:hypothetical protein